MLLLILLALLLPALALADGVTIISTPASNVFGIMVLDSDGRSVGTVTTHTNTDTSIEWTVSISPVTSTQGFIYTKNAAGNWINSGRTLNLTPFFGSNNNTVWYPVDGNNNFNCFDDFDDTSDSALAPWPEMTYAQYSVSVIPLPDDKRYQSRVGPSGTYAGGGAYKTYKIEYCDALFIEGNYVYVELCYTTVGTRRLYFQKSAFQSLYDVPQENLTGHRAVLTSATTARFGPGMRYDDFKEAALSANTPLTVFFSENGWVFAEFSCTKLGVVRGWLPAELVQAQ